MGRTSERRPTLDAVAARAGVARSTVSRVVNDSPRVSARAREAVRKAIDELGYLPDKAAWSSAPHRTDGIALIVPETETRLFAEPYFAAIIRGVEAVVADGDLQLLLTVVPTADDQLRLARYLETDRPAGALLVSVNGEDPLPGVLDRLGVPTVLGGRRSEAETLSCVHIENLGGARNAVDHLLSRGCRTVATLTGHLDQDAAAARLEGYRRALAEAGLPVDEELVGRGDFSQESGAAAMAALLERRPDLDGVFAASDMMAAGALRVLRESGRSVPDDVAVIGWDDSAAARRTDPPLTSVRQPTEEMGRAMARLLLEEIADPRRTRRQIVLGTELVRRASA